MIGMWSTVLLKNLNTLSYLITTNFVCLSSIVRIFNILIFNVWPTTNNYESSSFTNN
jgi:hypothetical protein